MERTALGGGVPLTARLCQLQQFAITRVSVKYVFSFVPLGRFTVTLCVCVMFAASLCREKKLLESVDVDISSY